MNERNKLAVPEVPVVEPELRNWGVVFRDRRKLFRTASIEGLYRSPQRDHHEPIPGDPEERPKERPDVLLALETWEKMRDTLVATVEIGEKPKANLEYFALTYWYAGLGYQGPVRPGYTGPPIQVVLRKLSQRAGYKVDLQGYCQLVYLGKCKMAPVLYKWPGIGYIAARTSEAHPVKAEKLSPIGRASYPQFSTPHISPTRAPRTTTSVAPILREFGIRTK